MKILIAVGVMRCREAGNAGVVFSHANELQKLGHDVDTWFLDDLLPSPRWPARFRDLEFSFAVARRIRKNPRQYDVVNLHAPCGAIYGLWGKIFPSRKCPPYVFTMQGSEERYVHAMSREQKKGRATHFAWKNRFWHRLYHQTMYDIAISTACYGNVANREGRTVSEQKYNHQAGHILYVPNGTGPEFFQTRTFADSPALRLLYVGTWLDRKGVFYLAEAFADLAPRLPQISLTVAGCSLPQEEIRAHFPAGLHSRIEVLPFLSRGEMPSLYAKRDIFVFPSLVEGMPLTLLEAMASSMPVVTTNTCGMADVVDDGYNGLLVLPADSASFSAAIERLTQSCELRRKLGCAAQETAHRYAWGSVVLRLERVLRYAVLARDGTALS